MIHAEDAIVRFHRPVLLVHGDADEAVPLSCSEETAKAYENAKLVVIPGDTHCCDYHLEQVLDTIREWMP